MATQLATVEAVRALVYESVFKRAQDIAAASDKLRGVAFEGPSMLECKAECLGSSPSDVYSLRVSVHGASAVGKCSCPAGANAKSGLCKHAVALLLRRVWELRGSAAEEEDPELTIPLASQTDDDVVPSWAGNSGSNLENWPAGAVDGPAASSRRALPAWMVGPVAADVATKPKKRAAAAAVPRPPPKPALPRARRPGGRGPRIANEGDDGREDGPGEVEDAGGPVGGACAVVLAKNKAVRMDDGEVSEPGVASSGGAAARERRRLRALKKEAVEDVEEKKSRGRPSRKAAPKAAVEGQAGRAPKRRRLARKYQEEEEESDFSEDEFALKAEEAKERDDEGDGFDLTDADLMRLAQENVESENVVQQAGEFSPKRQASPDNKKQDKSSRQGRQSTSMFSMSQWKQITSEGANAGSTLRSSSDDFDLGILKNIAVENSSQTSSRPDKTAGELDPIESLLSSPQRSKSVAEPSMSFKFESDDAVSNDMFNIMFGDSPAPTSVTASTSAPSWASQYDAGPSESPKDLVAATPVLVAMDPISRVSEPQASVDVLELQVRPKKKGSLKDKVKMFLS